MPRVVHFELQADQPERAIRFYSDVFGWQAPKWEGPMDYWMLMSGDEKEPGINGGLGGKNPDHPFPPCVVVLDVPSVDEYSVKVAENGGTIIVPKMGVPGVGWLAYFQDTEGITIGMMQFDPAAA